MFDDLSASNSLWRRQNATDPDLSSSPSPDDIASQARYARLIALHVSDLSGMGQAEITRWNQIDHALCFAGIDRLCWSGGDLPISYRNSIHWQESWTKLGNFTQEDAVVRRCADAGEFEPVYRSFAHLRRADYSPVATRSSV